MRWRQIKEERLREAVDVLGRLPGVHGLIVGGSLGRGEPWPMSDIDLLPVYADPSAHDRVISERAELVDWWAGTGHAQSLDLAWLAFTADEAREAVRRSPEWLAARLTGDRRWFHGVDKAYGGRAADPDDELTGGFVAWLTAARFHPAVVAARLDGWRAQARDALDEARARDDTPKLQEAARALRMILLESWGERLGSMGREWTRFERMADRHGHRDTARRVAVLAGAGTASATARAATAPAWLRERIDLCWAARTAVGEDVTPEENARDQLAAYAVHVTRHRPYLAGPWTGAPDPDFAEHLAELSDYLTRPPAVTSHSPVSQSSGPPSAR